MKHGHAIEVQRPASKAHRTRKRKFLISIVKVRMQEAELAKEKMHGRLACGRPLVVRLAGDKCMLETTDRSTKAAGEGHKMHLTGWWCHGTNKSQCKNCRYKKQIEILRGGEF
ncbi:hypothetical protein JHK87_019445 [Glycine soja]|nr:hypothetical protein JHK87_019445 [Glycine soja]